MKILVVGSRGMLGQDLVQVLSAEHEIIAWDREELDITNEKDVSSVIPNVKPDFIVNAAAYTAVDKCEEDFKTAVKVNAHAVSYLASACESLKIPVLHFSTDYVFNGEKSEGYNEDDAKDPLNAYGRSKALGEDLLLEHCSKSYILRISWLYGKHGSNFVDTMLKLTQTNQVIKVVDDQIGAPTYTMDVATKVAEIIKEKPAYGIYHTPNAGQVSWFHFAEEIFALSKMRVNLQAVPSSEFLRPAKRPSFSVLNNNKTAKLPEWQEALGRYLVGELRLEGL